MKKKNILSVVG